MSKDSPEIKLLLEFCQDIEATGGVVENKSGFLGPVADPDWSDLGHTYSRVCRFLGREPKVKKEER